jgi:signal transduction histidine kinase
VTNAPSPPFQAPRRRRFERLSSRLFAFTLGAILLIEALMFIPSAANERTAWLRERVEAGRLAALALDAAPMREVSDMLTKDLLARAGVYAVAEIEDDMRMILLDAGEPMEGEVYEVDLRTTNAFSRSLDTLGAFFAPPDRYLLIRDAGSTPARQIEVVVPHAPLKSHLQSYFARIALLSLLIALLAASLIYYLLHRLVVRPMARVSESVVRFKSDPGGWTRRLPPTERRDEIGDAQNALSDMEEAVAASFRERDRLANLGLAVAKINHDLRNTLAAASMVSESLEHSDDPRVKRSLPRLTRALERAIQLASDTLAYGRARPEAARLEMLGLGALLDEAAAEALAAAPGVTFRNDVAPGLRIDADPDLLHRIASNLIRNAAEAMQAAGSMPAIITARVTNGALEFADTGPGLSDGAVAALFKPFASTRAGGSGLGLVIAHELAEAMEMRLSLERTGPDGTVFRLAFRP